ncbi:MAG: hypothetical protein KGJ79_11060 [Alphaproteobacteria bacterium]|nr:hypothetical protein [Alphaproteobacteria bacterium]MDE2111670.1 hypothetical protein [Alphaproteobacteria bacterium]MDE2492826.1 hypothetical protein [Alphaproteobacteria bacterium]
MGHVVTGLVELAADANLANANRDKITDCQEKAAKTKKEERCIIIVNAAGM